MVAGSHGLKQQQQQQQSFFVWKNKTKHITGGGLFVNVEVKRKFSYGKWTAVPF